MGASATKGEEAASPPRPKTDWRGPSPALAEAASGMDARGRAAKLKSMAAVAKPLASAETGTETAGLLSAADILRLGGFGVGWGEWVGRFAQPIDDGGDDGDTAGRSIGSRPASQAEAHLRSVMGAGPMKARAGVARARKEMVRCGWFVRMNESKSVLCLVLVVSPAACCLWLLLHAHIDQIIIT